MLFGITVVDDTVILEGKVRCLGQLPALKSWRID